MSTADLRSVVVCSLLVGHVQQVLAESEGVQDVFQHLGFLVLISSAQPHKVRREDIILTLIFQG